MTIRQYRTTLLRTFNSILHIRRIQEHIHDILVRLIPKDEDLSSASTLRHILILHISYNLSIHTIYIYIFIFVCRSAERVSAESNKEFYSFISAQSHNQYTHAPNIRFKDILFITENGINYILDFDISLYIYVYIYTKYKYDKHIRHNLILRLIHRTAISWYFP